MSATRKPKASKKISVFGRLFSKKIAALVIVAVVATPVLSSWAFSYGPFVSVQPESGTISGPATLVADANASGGQSVRFNTASGSCPGAPNTPDGEDPWGGCWPGPTTTGVPSGVTVSNYGGPCTINNWNSSSPVILNAIDARSCPSILIQDALNVTITNSRLPAINMTDATGQLTITDSDIYESGYLVGALWGGNITGTRLKITGGQHSVHCESGCSITDSYLTGQNTQEGVDTHNNAFISNGGSNMTLRHNTLHCSPTQNAAGGGCTANLSLFGDFQVINNVTVDRNLFMATPSGGYCGTFGHNPVKPYGNNPANIHVSDNIFKRGSNNLCGVYNAVTSFLAANGSTWTNNRWEDNTILNP